MSKNKRKGRLPAAIYTDTGLRFFTVYGPWGRPDMAMYIFPKAISEGQSIRLFNRGEMRRDFTYIDDVVEAVERVIAKIPGKTELPSSGNLDPSSSTAPWRIYNIDNNRAVEDPRVVALLEQELGRKAKIELAPMQPGDVPETCAEIDGLMREVGFRPVTSIEDGMRKIRCLVSAISRPIKLGIEVFSYSRAWLIMRP